MQGTVLRSQLRTNVPGHTAVAGEVTFSSGVPAVASGTRFTVGRGVLSLTVASTPAIIGAANGTYANVPITTASGTTGFCSLTISGGAGVISAATVTAPGYDYTAAATMSVAVGSLFWTASSLASTTATAGTYYVSLTKANNPGTGMIAKVVTSGTAITSVVVNPSIDSSTALGTLYGTSPITFDLPVNALYPGSPAVTSAFVLTPNPGITVGTITTVITSNCSVVFANRVQSVVSAVGLPIVTRPGTSVFAFPAKRYDDATYVNFVFGVFSGGVFTAATPSDGDGLAFEIVATDTTVTA